MENIIECRDPISKVGKIQLKVFVYHDLVVNNLHHQLQLKVKEIKQEKICCKNLKWFFDSS